MSRVCTQCKKELDDDKFVPVRRRGWSSTKCSDCARANMAKWSQRVNTNPNNVSQSDD